jgi:polyhydroxybutyrate depolymerase
MILRLSYIIKKFRSIVSKDHWVLIKAFIGINLLSSPVIAGNNQKASFIHNGLKRTYKFYMPSSYNKSAGIPLVLALHGRGSNGRGMILLTHKGFNKLADKDGFIVVYPDGIELNWNDGRMDEEANDQAHKENMVSSL